MLIRVCNTRSRKVSPIGWLIMKYEHTDYHHSVVIINDSVYEAVGQGFRKVPLADWSKKNIIINHCDPTIKFNISEEDQKRVLNMADMLAFEKVPYGTMTLLGIIINDFTGWTWFADGQKTLICSEAVYTLFEEWLPPLTEPIDFISPKDIERLFFS